MNCLTNSGNISSRSCHSRGITAVAVGPRRITAASSTASSGDSTPAPLGATSRNAMAPGEACIAGSGAGDATVPGPRFSRSCWKSENTMVAWGTPYGLLMPRSFAPAVPRGERKKNPDVVPSLGGPKPAQLKEPPKHALGYSRGGFGTKVNLLVTNRGIVLGIYVTPGQQHESTAFEPLMRRILLPRRRGIPYWPAKLAGDKGYSYPHIRRWLKRHHIEPVIPTRKNQPREETFDKASYRQRNLIERVIGWFKECRALGTRYEKLAVDYVTLWMIAMIEKLL